MSTLDTSLKKRKSLKHLQRKRGYGLVLELIVVNYVIMTVATDNLATRFAVNLLQGTMLIVSLRASHARSQTDLYERI